MDTTSRLRALATTSLLLALAAVLAMVSILQDEDRSRPQPASVAAEYEAPTPRWLGAGGALLPESACHHDTVCLTNRETYDRLLREHDAGAGFLRQCAMAGELDYSRYMDCSIEEQLQTYREQDLEVMRANRNADFVITLLGGGGGPGQGTTVRCADGSISDAGGRQGACSHHGGVAGG